MGSKTRPQLAKINLILDRKSYTLLGILVSVAAVILFTSMVGCGFRGKPSTVVEEMIRLVERGEVDQAAKFNSQAFISRNGIDSIKESLRETALWIKQDGGIKSIEVLKEDTVGDVAEVTIKITRGGGDSSVVHYRLIWENGDWKIDGLASDPTLPAPSPAPSVRL